MRARACLHVGTWARERVHVALLIQNATRYAKLWRHLRPLSLHHIFRRYLMNGAIFGNKLLNIKCVFWFYLSNFYVKRFPILVRM
jgi:hypothetical protein